MLTHLLTFHWWFWYCCCSYFLLCPFRSSLHFCQCSHPRHLFSLFRKSAMFPSRPRWDAWDDRAFFFFLCFALLFRGSHLWQTHTFLTFFLLQFEQFLIDFTSFHNSCWRLELWCYTLLARRMSLFVFLLDIFGFLDLWRWKFMFFLAPLCIKSHIQHAE